MKGYKALVLYRSRILMFDYKSTMMVVEKVIRKLKPEEWSFNPYDDHISIRMKGFDREQAEKFCRYLTTHGFIDGWKIQKYREKPYILKIGHEVAKFALTDWRSVNTNMYAVLNILAESLWLEVPERYKRFYTVKSLPSFFYAMKDKSLSEKERFTHQLCTNLGCRGDEEDKIMVLLSWWGTIKGD